MEKQSDFLDLSIVKEEYTMDSPQQEPENEELMYDPTDIKTEPGMNNIKTESNMDHVQIGNNIVPVKLEYNEVSKEVPKKRGRKKKIVKGEKEYNCDICSKVFHKYDNFRNHKLLHSDDEFKCTICTKGFKTKRYLRKHLQTHANRPPQSLICPHCNKFMKTPKQYRRHVYRHESLMKKGIFKCDQCEKIYYSEADRSYHISRIHEEQPEPKPLTCETCGKVYYRKHCYDSHLLLHTGISFNCTLCTRTFRKKDMLDKHMVLHNNGQLFICNICGKTFNGEPYYKRHLLTHDKKSLPCLYCDKVFDRNETRFSHIRSVHPSLPTRLDGIPLVCKICKTAFEDIEILKEHVKVHSVKDRFECVFCGATFPTKKVILHHIEQNHDGEIGNFQNTFPTPTTHVHLFKPKHECGECGKKFYKLRNYKTHIENGHSTFKQLECAKCGKRYQTKETLSRHMKYHMKLYRCIQCRKCFGSKELLKRHGRQHGIIEHVLHCPHCNEVFRHIKILEKHVLRFHRDLETAIDSSVTIKTEPNEIQFEITEHMEDPFGDLPTSLEGLKSGPSTSFDY